MYSERRTQTPSRSERVQRVAVASCRIPFCSTPIPSGILADLKATKKPVADFVHCSPVLRLQEKVLDPRLVGKINWRCAVQRNDEGERVLAGVETGDAAIAAQQKFCKNEKEHVLILFLYADKTCVTGDSRISYWPIYLELANLHDKARLITLHVVHCMLPRPCASSTSPTSCPSTPHAVSPSEG